MAEVQTSTQMGEMTQRFIEFVMMQAQNAALFLGQIPNPQTGQAEVNLEVARMFIDQLAMIQEKTRGNLTKDEEAVLKNTVASLQLAFVEASKAGGAAPSSARREEAPRPQPESPASAGPKEEGAKKAEEPSVRAPEGESRKKFTKSYGS